MFLFYLQPVYCIVVGLNEKDQSQNKYIVICFLKINGNEIQYKKNREIDIKK